MCRVPTLAYSRMFIFQDPGYEEEVKLTLEIKFLQEHAVEIEKGSARLFGTLQFGDWYFSFDFLP